MEIICKIALVANADAELFMSNLNKRIDEMQKEGATVEIQYRPNETHLSALLIGRVNNG